MPSIDTAVSPLSSRGSARADPHARRSTSLTQLARRRAYTKILAYFTARRRGGPHSSVTKAYSAFQRAGRERDDCGMRRLPMLSRVLFRLRLSSDHRQPRHDRRLDRHADSFARFERVVQKSWIASRSGRHGQVQVGRCEHGVVIDEETQQYFQDIVDAVFRPFKAAVARGRRMDARRVADLCDARIYTATQALALGLIDEVALL